MVWWQVALVIIGAAALAMVAGLFLGRFLSQLWPRMEVSNREGMSRNNRDLNKYVNNRRDDSGNGKISVEEAWKIKQQAESKLNSVKQQYQTYQSRIYDKPVEQRSDNIETTGRIESGNRERVETEHISSERIIEKARLEAEARARAERINLEKAVSNTRKEIERQYKPEGAFKEQIENNGFKKDFLSEIRTNLKIATTPWTGKPLRFETTMMDNNKSEFDRLTSLYRADIREAYTDMAMANNIVWLVTDLGAGSKDLEDSYVKLCAKISERLSKLLQALSS